MPGVHNRFKTDWPRDQHLNLSVNHSIDPERKFYYGHHPPPTIRPAEQSDVKKIKNCVDRSYEHYTERIGKKPGPILDDYSKIVRNQQAFVAVLESRLVGVCVLIRKKGGILLDNIAVHPEFQNRGLGRKLIEFCESKVRKQGFFKLDLYTNVLMTENISLYQKLGYVETKRLTEKGFNRVYMSKTLI